MTDEEKRLFDALESQRKAHYESFDQRRSYEWKLSFGLWTAMAVFIGMLLTRPLDSGKFPVIGSGVIWIVAVVAALIIFVHAIFLIGMGRANNIDRRMSWHFEREMRHNHLELPFPDELEKELEKLRSRMGRIYNWSYGSQLVITVVLALATVAAVMVRI